MLITEAFMGSVIIDDGSIQNNIILLKASWIYISINISTGSVPSA